MNNVFLLRDLRERTEEKSPTYCIKGKPWGTLCHPDQSLEFVRIRISVNPLKDITVDEFFFLFPKEGKNAALINLNTKECTIYQLQ